MSDDTGARRLELISVALIALTALLTAWASFQASKWGGIVSVEFSSAGATRTESVRLSNLGNRQVLVDVGLFENFSGATVDGDDELATFWLDRMPERLAVATDAWLDTDPFESPDAPGSPFELSEYVVQPILDADELEAEADGHAADAREANERRENYTLVAVFLALVIFLAALSTKVEHERLRRVILVVSMVIFVATFATVALFPVEV